MKHPVKNHANQNQNLCGSEMLKNICLQKNCASNKLKMSSTPEDMKYAGGWMDRWMIEWKNENKKNHKNTTCQLKMCKTLDSVGLKDIQAKLRLDALEFNIKNLLGQETFIF